MIRQLISRIKAGTEDLAPDEHARIDEAVAVVRKHRAVSRGHVAREPREPPQALAPAVRVRRQPCPAQWRLGGDATRGSGRATLLRLVTSLLTLSAWRTGSFHDAEGQIIREAIKVAAWPQPSAQTSL